MMSASTDDSTQRNMLPEVPESRRDYSSSRLRSLDDALNAASLLDDHPLCIYVTGSYGRLEAWEGSDIDPFFLYDSADDSARFPWTSFVRLSARLIETAQELKFPPFSKDGQYLEVQYVSQMEQVLGSPRDDSLNAFTARMLLLLESQPLHDEGVYLRLLRRIIGFYYRDFDDHSTSFMPTFMINDILRFWRTLTLNYEHHRVRLNLLTGRELEEKKADSALKNYKLKVSRLATCFSMVANLSSMPVPVTAEQVFELCRLTPSDRFDRLRLHGSKAEQLTGQLAELYAEFLDQVQRESGALNEEFSVAANRKAALDRASRYGDLIYELLDELTPDERMRFLVI